MIFLLKTELKKKDLLLFALNEIYGIGYGQAVFFCKKLGVSKNFRVYELTTEQTNKLLRIIYDSNQLFTNDLKKLHIITFKQLISIKTYKGLRRLKGLPVRGQRTHTNAKTAKFIK